MVGVPIDNRWDTDTLKRLYRRGTVDENSDGWTGKHADAVAHVTPCVHPAAVVTCILSRCHECGLLIAKEVNTDVTQAFTNVRQGLIDAESAITGYSLSDSDAEMIKLIPRCDHPTKVSYTCMDGLSKQRCVECLRVFSRHGEEE